MPKYLDSYSDQLWLARLRHGSLVYLAKEKQFAHIECPYDNEAGWPGRIGLKRHTKCETWWIQPNGRGLDGSQCLLPVEDEVCGPKDSISINGSAWNISRIMYHVIQQFRTEESTLSCGDEQTLHLYEKTLACLDTILPKRTSYDFWPLIEDSIRNIGKNTINDILHRLNDKDIMVANSADDLYSYIENAQARMEDEEGKKLLKDITSIIFLLPSELDIITRNVFTLSNEEIIKSIVLKNDGFVAGWINHNAQTILFLRGNLKLLNIPIGDIPSFYSPLPDNLQLTHGGWHIKCGDELTASTHDILMRYDSEYEKLHTSPLFTIATKIPYDEKKLEDNERKLRDQIPILLKQPVGPAY